MGLGWNPVLFGEPIVKNGMTIVGITCDMTEDVLAKKRSTYEINGSVMAEETVPFSRSPDSVHVA